MYTPHNYPVFQAAFEGCVAGMTVSGWIRSDDMDTYARSVVIAGTYSKAVDKAFAPVLVDDVEMSETGLQVITQLAQTLFAGRAPSPTRTLAFYEKETWEENAEAVRTVVLTAGEYLAHAVTPNPGPPPGPVGPQGPPGLNVSQLIGPVSNVSASGATSITVEAPSYTPHVSGTILFWATAAAAQVGSAGVPTLAVLVDGTVVSSVPLTSLAAGTNYTVSNVSSTGLTGESVVSARLSTSAGTITIAAGAMNLAAVEL